MATIRLSTIRAEQRPMVGVSLDGPASVTAGTSAVYTITDYDTFSAYAVTTTVGTASISRDKITLTIPPTAIATQTTLSVSINKVAREFIVSLKAGNTIARPSIQSPVTGTTGISTSVTLQASSFASLPVGSLTHTASNWMIALDTGFTNVVKTETITTGDLDVLTADLSLNTKYYARVRYISNSVTSEWSNVINFTTTSTYVQKPVVSAQNGQTTNIGIDPTFVSSTFIAVPANSDTHISSTWIVRKTSDNSIVYQVSNSTANKLSVTIPVSSLAVSTSYSIEVKYTGQLGVSAFSDKLTFTTASAFVPTVVGTAYQGGYYAGRINIGGILYALIVAPKSGGETSIKWTDDAVATSPVNMNDGLANTNQLAQFSSTYLIAAWVKGLSIGGYRDWYIPSVDELEICYRNLKPTSSNNIVQSSGGPRGAMGYNPSSIPSGPAYTTTSPSQTTSTLFKTGGAQAFNATTPYWTSVYAGQSPLPSGWNQEFTYGQQGKAGIATAQLARAVRRVRIS